MEKLRLMRLAKTGKQTPCRWGRGVRDRRAVRFAGGNYPADFHHGGLHPFGPQFVFKAKATTIGSLASPPLAFLVSHRPLLALRAPA
jgi:hypothetical protein